MKVYLIDLELYRMKGKTHKIKRSKLLFMIFSLMFIYSCSKESRMSNNDLNNIVDSIYNTNNSLNRNIDFKNINNRKWDRMYVLDVDNNAELDDKKAVSRRLNIQYDGCKNDVLDRSILFLEGDKISFEICSKFKEANWEDSQYFVSFRRLNLVYFTPENAVFKIIKRTGSKGYYLIPTAQSQ